VPRLNFDWVTPRLAVGGRFLPEEAPALERLEIRHVIDLRAEERDDAAALERLGIALLHLPTPDTRPVAQAQLTCAVRWLNERQQAGGRALIHCQHGVGRSALAAACVLVSRGRSPLEALETIKRARAAAAPSADQLAALVEWADSWRRAHEVRWRLPALGELTAIAWRAPE